MIYAIIDREEFISLYKFGEIVFQPNRIIRALNDKDAEMALLSKLKELPLCEYEEDYLIISLDETITISSYLDINHIIELIPLSSRSQKGYQRKFEEELRFNQPRFESILEDYFEYVKLIEHKNGAKALTRACNCMLVGSSFISDGAFIEAFRRKNNGERSHSFQGDFLTHLLVYDRYDFFPNSDLGYLYDIGTILANSKGKSNFIGSTFHSFLEKNRDQFDKYSLSYIFKEIDSSSELEGLRSSLTSKDGVRLYIAATIYLKYKNELKNSKSVAETSLRMVLGKKRADHEFIDEFDLAIYLTGLFFGYQKFNKEIYVVSNLRILKHYPLPIIADEGKFDSGALPLIDQDKPKTIEESKNAKDDVKYEAEHETGHPLLEVINENVPDLPETIELKYKQENIINKIEEIFERENKEYLIIRDIKSELGFKTNRTVKNFVKMDPKERFEVKRIRNNTETLIKSTKMNFNHPKSDIE